MKKVKVAAPGKLLLLGDHAVVYGRPCLVAAIDKKVVVTTASTRAKESVFVSSARSLFEKKYDPVKEGFSIKGFDSRYGLGSSAAVTVAVSKAMFQLKNIAVSQKELFDFCYQVVRQVQGLGSGFDIAASIYGGVTYFVTGGKKIEKLKVGQLPLVVGYSGVKADTPGMVKLVAAKISESFLQQSEDIVNHAKKVVLQNNWQALGSLMNQNQKILESIGASTPKLDKMVRAALTAGAYGAKLSGAGGGDCMIALHRDGLQSKFLVEKAISQVGGEILNIKLAI